MSKDELWKKVKVAFEKGYVVTKDATVKASKQVAIYAGEAGHLTKHKYSELRINKQLAKEFAAIGARVYALSKKGDGKNLLADPAIKKSLAQSKKLDADLHKAQDLAKAEMKKIRSHAKKKAQKK